MAKNYIMLADEIADRIRSGKLRAGERLPPQRHFAFEKGIANSTAGRVYAELVKRGLVAGEIGRGSFVLAWPPTPKDSTLLEARSDIAVDLETSFPILTDQPEMMAPALQGLARPDALRVAIRPVRTLGCDSLWPHRKTSSEFLGCKKWCPDPSSILFAGSGRQAIGAAMMALVPIGGRLGVEALTYPILKGLAGNLGRVLVPVPIDREGLVPEELASCHQARALDAVYVQPTLHNPTGQTMGIARRQAIAELAIGLNLPVIEDQVYRFLVKAPPPSISSYAPENVILIDSLSKRLAPGLSLGLIAAPPNKISAISTAMKQCGWISPRFPIEAATRWITDGTISRLDTLKRSDVAERWQIAHAELKGQVGNSRNEACHLWIDLPEHWSSDEFVSAAATQGIAVASGAAFGVGYIPNATRISLVSTSRDTLRNALSVLNKLIETGREQHGQAVRSKIQTSHPETEGQ